jgi:hypothetical protein
MDRGKTVYPPPPPGSGGIIKSTVIYTEHKSWSQGGYI